MLPAVSQFIPLPSIPTATPLKSDTKIHPSANPDRLTAAVKDFEATFLGLLLKEMRQTLDTDGGGGLFAGDAGDIQGGLFDLILGKHLADAGGVGFAAALSRNLRYTTNAHPLPSTAGAGAPRAASA